MFRNWHIEKQHTILMESNSYENWFTLYIEFPRKLVLLVCCSKCYWMHQSVFRKPNLSEKTQTSAEKYIVGKRIVCSFICTSLLLDNASLQSIQSIWIKFLVKRKSIKKFVVSVPHFSSTIIIFKFENYYSVGYISSVTGNDN